MLVLHRKPGQRVRIGHDISVWSEFTAAGFVVLKVTCPAGMSVRRCENKLMLGDEITAYVLSNYGRDIRIGFEAPESIAIWREEIYLKIQEEKEQAA